MKNYTLINKNFILSENATISVKERGFKFGDGIFETCKIHNFVIYDYESHEKRLKEGLQALKIEFNIVDLKEKCLELIQKNNAKNGILRISISRGIGSMGYLPASNIEALLVVETFQERKVKSEEIIIGISEIALTKKPSWLQNCKTSQSLNYILAKIEARKNSHFDDLMLNEEGFVGECSSSNLFFIKDEKIYTPSLDCDILNGTMRQNIMKKFDVKECKIKKEELFQAEEIFLTNSNLLVLSVDKIEYDGKIKKFQKIIGAEILAKITQDLNDYCKKNGKNI